MRGSGLYKIVSAVVAFTATVTLRTDMTKSNVELILIILLGSSSGQSMVGFTANGRRSYLNGALIYSYILSEVGGGFNASTGVFTCPVARLYLVSMTLQAESTGRINCFLYKNGLNTNLEIDVDGEGKREEPASQTAVLKLRQGDTLYIGSCPVYVGSESTFTVVLIQADIQN